MNDSSLTTTQKALAINLDARIYGTFAEIGAGQEVVRNFFQAGGAAGTVAKSMSAYDMAFSDAIYGKEESGRYVCENRLTKMLDKEYKLLETRLSDKRAQETLYFVFADTVAAKSYARKDMECHGWLGLRFQLKHHAEPSSIHVHVRMLDSENLRQQEALGAIGVNLLYGAFFLINDPKKFIESLVDNIAPGRIEVDMVRFIGPDFQNIDNRLMSLHLIKSGLTDAALFAPDGRSMLPSDVLYKKPVLVQRGSFRPPTLVNFDMHQAGYAQFIQEPEVAPEKNSVVVLKEITMHNLLSSGEIDPSDFLARVDLVGALGYHVLISNFYEYYRLSQFLSRYTKKMIGVILGIRELNQLFDEEHYKYLEGGLLEAFGKMLSRLVKVYVYPWKESAKDDIVGADNYAPAKHLDLLYRHLVNNNRIVAVKGFNANNLHIISRYVLEMIQTGKPGWEKLVPDLVAKTIKDKGLFGFSKNRGAA